MKIKTIEHGVPRVQYPLPAPIIEPELGLVVITPDRTVMWNKSVSEGILRPYVYFGFDERNYLTLAQWLQDVLRYIIELRLVVDAYADDVERHNQRLKKLE